MTHKRPLFFLATLFGSVATAQSPSPDMVVHALSQVGQVVASECAGREIRTGTAFVWPDRDKVVTARHVVAGCTNVRVQFPDGPSLSARADRELVERDLIVLQLMGSSQRDPFRISTDVPPVHSEVAVVGYALGAPTPDDKLLRVTAGNALPIDDSPRSVLLRDFLPPSVVREIGTTGPWNLDTEILRLDGNMVNGHSGAPLLSADGTVVAIGAGGLQFGASGIVWAVQASYLADAEGWQSVPVGFIPFRPSSFSFADQPPQNQVPTVECGDFSLRRERTASLRTLRASIDDPLGLDQIVARLAPSLGQVETLNFDIWVDLQSGAAIPIPAGTELTSGTAGCQAMLSPFVDLNIVTHHVQPSLKEQRGWEIQNFSSVFETRLGFLFPQGLRQDPQWSYRAPATRSDGLVANRKGFDGSQWIGPNIVGQDYVFVTHVSRGLDYVGVGAIRKGTTIQGDTMTACLQSGNLDPCRNIIDPHSDWSKAVLAVHMTTLAPI